MKILITSYYGLREALLLAANSLKKLGFTVVDFPLYMHLMDVNSKRDDYLELLVKFIEYEKPDIILWWYIGLSITDMKIVNNTFPKIKFFFYNWDEPNNWSILNLRDKAKYLDCAFICCNETTTNYIDNGSKDSQYLLPGYSPDIHYKIINQNDDDRNNYSCDISFCTTNLYDNEGEFPNQYINRKILVDNIYHNQDKYGYKFYIYGPEKFKKLYPKSYRGFVKYEDSNKVFNYSKINLCTHVLSNKDQYLNERAILITGSNGLLFIDDIKGLEKIFIPGKECVIIDKDNYLIQIKNILENYDKYIIIKDMGNQKSVQYTWDKWAQTINKKI